MVKLGFNLGYHPGLDSTASDPDCFCRVVKQSLHKKLLIPIDKLNLIRYIKNRNNKQRGKTMNKIYVATKLRSEDYGVSDVSVLAVGSYDDCKKAVRAEWEKYAEHDDIGEW